MITSHDEARAEVMFMLCAKCLYIVYNSNLPAIIAHQQGMHFGQAVTISKIGCLTLSDNMIMEYDKVW